jgi:hypothetical protein
VGAGGGNRLAVAGKSCNLRHKLAFSDLRGVMNLAETQDIRTYLVTSLPDVPALGGLPEVPEARVAEVFRAVADVYVADLRARLGIADHPAFSVNYALRVVAARLRHAARLVSHEMAQVFASQRIPAPAGGGDDDGGRRPPEYT